MQRVLLIFVALFLNGTADVFAQIWKPEKNVELIVPSAAGGGLDRTGRVVQRIWQENKMFSSASAVVNKPGGSGNIGYTYLSMSPTDGHYLMVSSPTLLTNHITGTGKLNYTDFTPIAQLSSEYLVMTVKADSPIKSGREVIERLKKDPAALSIAIGSVVGGANHIGIGAVFKAAGIDIKKLRVVVFKSGTESVTALMGGHVDLATGAPEQSLSQVEAGKVRVIAIAAPQRLGGIFSNVPTWKELGINVEADTWRGIIGPKGMSNPQVTFWNDVIARMVATETWKKEVEKHHWAITYRNSSESSKFLDAEYQDLKSVLTELGLAKK